MTGSSEALQQVGYYVEFAHGWWVQKPGEKAQHNKGPATYHGSVTEAQAKELERIVGAFLKSIDEPAAPVSASAPQPSSATPMVALRRLHEVVGQLLVERDLPWEHKEWDELPQAEKVAMAEAIRRVFFVPSETPAGGTAKVPEEIQEWIWHLDLHLTEHDDRHARMALRAAWPVVRGYFLGEQPPAPICTPAHAAGLDEVERELERRYGNEEKAR